ncbi:hypothetical protein JTE90_014720 [Oedothorax gibbosus]|uniref:Uncharacterized protein n=1 Tax=Oedothorax gibbosus TaxID=931172 RepID=A0AAV6UR20_9ARAC|nr:hypothetical protein JTE90_014720 [Oedothorax gibbosus]
MLKIIQKVLLRLIWSRISDTCHRWNTSLAHQGVNCVAKSDGPFPAMTMTDDGDILPPHLLGAGATHVEEILMKMLANMLSELLGDGNVIFNLRSMSSNKSQPFPKYDDVDHLPHQGRPKTNCPMTDKTTNLPAKDVHNVFMENEWLMPLWP